MDDTYRPGPLLLLGGRSNRSLAAEIGEIIGKSPDGATIKQFSDGEIFVSSMPLVERLPRE
jgi:phosphoribosylpyrophosphate synthetase